MAQVVQSDGRQFRLTDELLELGGVLVTDATAESAQVVPDRLAVQDPACGEVRAGLSVFGDPFLQGDEPFVVRHQGAHGNREGNRTASTVCGSATSDLVFQHVGTTWVAEASASAWDADLVGRTAGPSSLITPKSTAMPLRTAVAMPPATHARLRSRELCMVLPSRTVPV